MNGGRTINKIKKMLISPDNIQRIKETTNIIDIVNDYVVLKKVGQNQMGLCPFHDDRSPSFSVTEDKQLYHCFGCDESGDVISFLTKINNQSFIEVVKELATRQGIALEFEGKESQEDYLATTKLIDKLRDIMGAAREFYIAQLDTDSGKQAKQYLLENRKITPDAIAKFRLGYAPSGGKVLYEYLVNEHRYDAELGVKAGLLIKNRDNYYDRFRGRLIIPIEDHLNRIIAFSGRALDGEQPKYLHSPETKLFNKSQILYGLNHAIKSIGEKDFVIVVEGYFDAIALYQAGITNVVACQGTALTRSQVHKALKYTQSKRLVILFDGDIAGQKASEKSIETLSELVCSLQIDLRLLTLPANQDPDDWLKANSSNSSFLDLIESSPYWINWVFTQIMKNKDLKNPHDVTTILGSFVKTLSKIQSQSIQSYYIIYAAELLGGGDSHQVQIYSNAILKAIGTPAKVNISVSKKKNVAEFVPSVGLSLVNAIIHYPDKSSYIRGEVINHCIIFTDDSTRKIWNYLIKLDNSPTLSELIEEFKTILPDEQLEFLLTKHDIEALDSWIRQLKREGINAQMEYHKNLWSNCQDSEQGRRYYVIWNNLLQLLANCK